MKYQEDPEVKKEIDVLLKELARLTSNLGIDSTTGEIEVYKVKEEVLFEKIKIIDPEYHKLICP